MHWNQQLLLRSTKHPATSVDTRIDVLFKGVGFISIGTRCDGFIVTLSSADEHVGLLPEGQPTNGQHVYKIVSRKASGLIIAVACVTHEDDGEYYDPSSLLQGPYLGRD